MTQEDIILMADASGLSYYGMGKDRERFIAHLQRFAELVAKGAALAKREWNFCERCGKRTADLTVIHTCTPPRENT
jgi:hypothetical protein